MDFVIYILIITIVAYRKAGIASKGEEPVEEIQFKRSTDAYESIPIGNNLELIRDRGAYMKFIDLLGLRRR